jgi:hypothetical protein
MSERQLTRNEFYKLAHECRDYALRLANNDQDVVSRDLCREFNAFLERVRTYDRLEQPLKGLKKARGLTRNMMLGGTMLVWFLASVLFAQVIGQGLVQIFTSGAIMVIIAIAIVPPGSYGTSVEAIEGRVLVVVQALQKCLESGEMGFSEAAFFVVRDVLREAAAELRQQVYLSRRAR